MIAGVDGCRGGWIAATQTGGVTSLKVLESLDILFRDETLVVAVIDMPIGLPERGSRPCDLLARKLLGKARGSSVFPAPIQAMLAARDHKEASDLRYGVEAKRCSIQLAAILPKIRELNNLMTPELQLRAREGHPEVSFAVMNADRPMSHPKRLQAGRAERTALLDRSFPDVTARLAEVGSFAGDAVDAYAMLWTAQRIAAGTARVLGRNTDVDTRGIRMEIVA